jgi:hypothetical protein
MRDGDLEVALDSGQPLDEIGGDMLDQEPGAPIAPFVRAGEAAAEKTLVGNLGDHG